MPSPVHPSALSFANGSLIAGKYLVEKEIAAGGVGIVVLAKNLALQHHVAIKYLSASALQDQRIVARFVREARLVASITSDHVVRVFDVETLPDGSPFMIMEYLTGHDLGTSVERGPLPVAEAVDYVLQACDGLAEAHSLSIVHRDIKPQNLFLAQRPSNMPIVKILDFGISKAALHGENDGLWRHQTGVNDQFGTPVYMSPEQLRSSASVDGRSDIWSLGVVLYELLTGVVPFDGEDVPQICVSVLEQEPKPLATARPDVPHELDRIILRCLEKDPSKRFQNVAELVQELVVFAPPLAAARAARIRDVVIAGGATIRALGATTPLAASTAIRALRAPVPKKRRVAVASLVASLCATAVVVGSGGIRPRASSVTVSAPDTRVAAVPRAEVTAEPVPQSPTEAPHAAMVSNAALSAAPKPSLPPPRGKGIASPSSQRTVAAPGASATQSPSQRMNRRALFGERI